MASRSTRSPDHELPSHESSSYEIVLATGPDSARIIPLTGRKQTLGRSQSCGIRIDDGALEAHHAVISKILPSAKTGLQLESVIEPLGGKVEIRGSSFRVGATECLVHPAISSALINRPSLSTRPFHRSPQSPIEHREVPVEPTTSIQPSSAAAPPWAAISGGVATGLIVAAITGQVLFGIFSLVTAGIAGVTWVIQRRSYRRSLRRWTAAMQRNQDLFDHQCLNYARHLAEKRRLRHRPLGALLLAAHLGENVLWAKREINEVCIGFGSRQVLVTPNARPLAFNDIPVTVSCAPGSVIGIYGPRAMAVSTALVMRLAVEIGPSDWRLLIADELPALWSHLQGLPHLRARPLTRNDLTDGGGGSLHDDGLHDVVLVTESHQMAHRHSVPSRYVESHRATLLICAPTLRDLPATCTDIIDSSNAELDGVGTEGARNIIEALSQWHDPDAQTLAIPHHVQLEDVDSVKDLDARVLRQRWLSQSLRFDLGLSAEGPIGIDLAVDGPHMIVVGTTGSGKSELLRSLVVSLALQASPTEVNFILFDYKGGSAFDRCACLPHVVGVVTDLDRDDGYEKTATRVLRGLEAELRRREHMLRRVGLSDQKTYQLRRQQADEPMPRLVIVVDELAALRADVPEAVPALIAIAQRGRSLGLHLVLATQRPGTELTPDVMANTTIRLALRMQTQEDSKQVIGYGGAADLSRHQPGRALLTLGSESPEEFQSLYVSRDLMAVVAMTSALAVDLNIATPRRPWCPPLAEQLSADADRCRFSVGLIDDPERQQQPPLLWEPRRHLLVTMGPGSGKTSTLHTLAAISQQDDPKASLYFLSGSGNHEPDSSWIAVSDRERLHRLLQFLINVIEERRTRRQADDRITLMIDDVDLWRSHHSDDRLGSMQWELFERVVSEGPAVGVFCVMTTSHTQLLPAVLKSRIEQQWRAGKRPGSVLVSTPKSRLGLSAQIFDPRTFAADIGQFISVPDADRCTVLATLPQDLWSSERRQLGSFGVRADTLMEATLDSTRTLRHIVLGHRYSGRTTAFEALVAAWKDLHPNGMVLDGSQSDDSLEALVAIARDDHEVCTLVAIDDAERRTLRAPLVGLIKQALDPSKSDAESRIGGVSVVASTSVSGLRSQSDHWLHALRRYRSGVLLGRCAEEDGDLFGQYARSLHIVPQATSRGLWIEDGESMSIIQFFRAVAEMDEESR